MRRTVLTLFLVPLLLVMSACAPLENIAVDGIATAKGFIEDQQTQHLAECQAAPTKNVCQVINQSVAAQNLAIDALSIYCADAAFLADPDHAPCHPVKDAAPKLQLALKNLSATIGNVKALLNHK